MPLVKVGSGNEAVSICYQVYESAQARSGSNGRHQQETSVGDETKTQHVVMIMGVAAGKNGWAPQLYGLLQHDSFPHGTNRLRLLTLDNRGVGESSCPASIKAYSTERMARDVLAVMDHVGWGSAHIVGHSMGGMVATRLAVRRPDRVDSLTIVSSTNGGWQAVPWNFRTVKYCFKAFRAKTAASRAKFDLKLHFMPDFLKTPVKSQGKPQGEQRKVALLREYIGWEAETPQEPIPGPPPADPQNNQNGVKGQLRAVWKHHVTAKEFETLRAASFLKQVVHGRHDLLAAPKYSEWLAARLGCRCIMLQGAHFVSRECCTELNSLLRDIIFTRVNIHLYQPQANDTSGTASHSRMESFSVFELAR